MKKLIFPLSFAFNSFSMQFLVVVAGLSGHHAMAADLSLAQAAMILLFFSLSGNARNLILKSANGALQTSIVQMRTILAPVLAVAALLICVQFSGVGLGISLALVLRQLAEWFAEIELSRLERTGSHGEARLFLAALALPLFAAAVALLAAPWFFIPLLYVWAVLPLLLCAGGIKNAVASLSHISIEWHKVLPNCASTLIIGTVVFFFRILIAVFAGKEIAGQLFTAFALGGVIGAVYERTIGPSLKVSAELSGLRLLLFRAAWGLPLAGAALVCAVVLFPNAVPYIARNPYLVGGAGFSLAGGFVMLWAQAMKINILHSPERDNVFIADLISNFAILILVPVVFLLFGKPALMSLFMLNAIMTYLAYWMAGGAGVRAYTPGKEKFLQVSAAFAVVAPVFFQLGTGVYRGHLEIYDWGGMLLNLPIPLSMLACLPLILLGNAMREAKSFAMFSFAIFAFMLFGTVASSGGDQTVMKDKLMLSLQYIFPFFGLVLAELLGGGGAFLRRVGRVFLAVVVTVAAMQLAAALFSGSLRLQPYLYLFSIYNNAQYAAVIFTAAYLVGLYAVYDSAGEREKAFLYCAVLLMCTYTVLSWSLLAIGLFWGGTLLFWVLSRFRRGVTIALVCSAAVCAFFWTLPKSYGADFYLIKGSDCVTISCLKERQVQLAAPVQLPIAPYVVTETAKSMPPNVNDRFYVWRFYIDGLKRAGARAVTFGHPAMPNRKTYPSAHNYYLDLLYNFGLLVLVPFLGLVFYTFWLVWVKKRLLLRSRPLTGLAFVVLFLVLADNSFKVGLRQPYPGIFSFFLWGTLLVQLRLLPTGKD